MRNLMECQAEVFRRSEKRIKERKQRRKHVLMACIPLVLCLGVFSVIDSTNLKISTPTSNGSMDLYSAGAQEIQTESQSFVCSLAEIQVTGPDFSKTYRKVSDILEISDYLHGFGYRSSESNSAASGGLVGETQKEQSESDDSFGYIADCAAPGYKITLVMHEGGEEVYYLLGDTLENQITGQSFALGEKQVEKLKELLGIPE